MHCWNHLASSNVWATSTIYMKQSWVMMSVQLLGWHSDKQHRLQTVTWYRWNGHKKAKDWVKSTTTVMKKGTNTKMKYQQGQTRLSSQYAKRGVSKFTLRTYISFLPYQVADHLTFEGRGGGGGAGGDFWSARIFFSQTFFTLLISLQEFFSLKKGQSKFL